MKKLTVVVAGLGSRLLKRSSMREIAGMRFASCGSIFPSLTCVAQASIRTDLPPAEHGILFNGWWSHDLRRPFFWEQSAKVVKGDRVWRSRRGTGGTVGLFFFQQSLGEEADVIISPAPIHKHGGGMIMSCYTQPTGMEPVLKKLCGSFPLWRYWGPFASPKVGRMCIRYFEEMTNVHDVDEAYLYLPTLDYAAQKHGPDSSAAVAALREFRRQLEHIVDICMRRSCKLEIYGDYEITEVTAPPVHPNVILRKDKLFKTREVGGMAYPDFYQSTAFAVCDHEVCVLYGFNRELAATSLLITGKFEEPDPRLQLKDAIVLLAKPGSWCGYEWWTDKREAPDFANHVDIHNKPGFDPKELFLFNRGCVRGTHGRRCEIAYAR